MAPSGSDGWQRADKRTINMAKDANKDRFALPGASVLRSQTGKKPHLLINNSKLAYGLQERLCVKRVNSNSGGNTTPLWTPRQSVSTNSKQLLLPKENPNIPVKQVVRPSPYLAAMEVRNKRESYQVILNRGAARCANTAFGSRKWDTAGVRAALTWPLPAEPAEQASPRAAFLLRKKSPYYHLNRDSWSERPATAPEPSSHLRSNNSLAVVSRQLVFRTTTPRFAAHAAAEQRREETPDRGVERNRARLQYHEARRVSQQAKQQETQALADQWPHGLPSARRQSAEAKGLRGLGGLGYGNSAQSMPQKQFLALRSTIKMP